MNKLKKSPRSARKNRIVRRSLKPMRRASPPRLDGEGAETGSIEHALELSRGNWRGDSRSGGCGRWSNPTAASAGDQRYRNARENA